VSSFPAVLTFSVCCLLFIANSQWDMIGPRDNAAWNSLSDDLRDPTLSTDSFSSVGIDLKELGVSRRNV